ncbi:BTAD domain-containing putative transcriptional regulator [Spirillospora sp. CA-294931]|uniref:BTAD domain-containing putative transcriptional regulator n=1 Tax=Spirillospora sp. CA-294931 TaxID=3240042 RepID=UPI003D8D0636
MRFGVLGPLAVSGDDGTPVAVPRADVRALLAVLVVHEGFPVPVERLIADLWPETVPANPANALQIRVSRLRRALEAAGPGGRGLVEHGSSAYRLRVRADAVDTARFRALLDRARATGDPWTRKGLLSDALALWRGPALAGFEGEPFARPVAERLGQQRLDAVQALAEARLDLGEHDALAADLAGWVREHPERERLRAAMMRALYRSGRQGEALAAYDEYRRDLADGQGLDPGVELVRLQRAILARDPALDAPPAPRRGGLPVPVTALVGRDEAVEDVLACLDTARLVTLTGPGGVGKTRLGLAAAARLEDACPDGVWLVELAGLSGGDAVAEAVMAVLGIRENAMLGPVPSGEPMSHADRLAAFLRGKELLLLLDNCEHVAAPVAELVAALLASAPGLRVLATGREPLGVPGEVLRPVPPLEAPAPGADAGRVREASAVRLFCARASDADPGFVLDASNAQAVADLVRGLDGLPLALELAAAKVRALGVRELAARLPDRLALLAAGNRGAPARQRTLGAVLDWSWDLLTEPERIVLRRLAVLDGGPLAAVEAVCSGGPVPPSRVAAVLARLVDRSMVTVTGDRRYRLLETVGVYARARLDEAGELESVRDRHHRHHLALAENGAPELFGPGQADRLARLDAEHRNLHCALEHAIRRGDAASALRLVDALAWSFLLRGRVRQAARWAGLALAVPGSAPSGLRARVLCWEAGIAALLDIEQDAAARARAALAAFEGAEDPHGLAMARWFLAYVLLHAGDLDTSEKLAADASAGFEALGHRWGLAVTTGLRANHALTRGDLATAADASGRAVALFRALGDRGGELLTVYPRAALAEIRGDHREAERLHREGLALAEGLGMWAEAADRLCGLGRVAMLRGDLGAARELHERGRRLAAEHGFKPGEVYAAIGLGQTARLAGDLDAAAGHLRTAADWYRRTGRAPGHATVLTELGLLAERRGDAREAAGYHRRALALARRLGDPRAEAAALDGLAAAGAPATGP